MFKKHGNVLCTALSASLHFWKSSQNNKRINVNDLNTGLVQYSKAENLLMQILNGH